MNVLLMNFVIVCVLFHFVLFSIVLLSNFVGALLYMNLALLFLICLFCSDLCVVSGEFSTFISVEVS